MNSSVCCSPAWGAGTGQARLNLCSYGAAAESLTQLPPFPHLQFDNGVTGDAGLEGFVRSINGSFPVLSCNLDTTGEPALAGLVQRFALLPLQHSNVTVGVVGLTSVETPETSNPGPSVRFLPYADTLPACVADARAAGADLILALTHIGFEDDQALAASPAAAGVDLIVGACGGSQAAFRQLQRQLHGVAKRTLCLLHG